MNAIDSLAERAQRMLDGMSVNREAFARDVLALTEALQRRVAAETAQRQEVEDAMRPRGTPPPTKFAEAFNDIFKQTT